MEKLHRIPIFMVSDLETLKVLTDPLRLQILELLDPKPQTVNDIANKLGLSSSRLYYHFNMLEQHGLINVVETRMVNNMFEKLYWLTAENIDVEKDLLNFSSESGQENVTKIITSSLDATREDILRSIQARKFHINSGGKPNPREMILSSSKKRLKDETYQAFVKQLNELTKAFSALTEEIGEGQDINVFSFVCYLYPSYYFDETESDQ